MALAGVGRKVRCLDRRSREYHDWLDLRAEWRRIYTAEKRRRYPDGQYPRGALVKLRRELRVEHGTLYMSMHAARTRVPWIWRDDPNQPVRLIADDVERAG